MKLKLGVVEEKVFGIVNGGDVGTVYSVPTA